MERIELYSVTRERAQKYDKPLWHVVGSQTSIGRTKRIGNSSNPYIFH